MVLDGRYPMRASPTAALIAALFVVPFQGAGAQTHAYQLFGTYADQYGGPSLVPHGGTLTSTGYAFGPNQALTLSNVFTPSMSYTLVLHSSFVDVNGWRKMVDFANLQSDMGFYNYFGSSTLYFSNVYGLNSYQPNVLATTVMTRDVTTDIVTWYVDGVKQFQYTDGAKYSEFTGPNGVATFFEDDVVVPGDQSEAGAGLVDYIGTYDRVLTDAEVANIVVPSPEPGSLALAVTGLIGIALIVRRKSLRRR